MTTQAEMDGAIDEIIDLKARVAELEAEVTKLKERRAPRDSAYRDSDELRWAAGFAGAGGFRNTH